MRRDVLGWLKPFGGFPIENPACPGTPDVGYVGGYMELKQIRRWPRAEDAIVTIDHWTPQQILWHQRWERCMGVSFVLLKVGRKEYLLFHGNDAAKVLGKVDRLGLLAAQVMHCPNGMEVEELLTFLRRWS